MHKAMSVFLLMISFGLNGCIPVKRSAVHMMPSRLPATATPVALQVTYATLPPPETATATSTPIPTPILPALNNAVVKDQIDHLATEFLAAGKNSGLGIALVIRNPQTGELEGMFLDYGATAKDNAQPINSNTIYEIGSITKLFTGILLAQAVEAGKVQLNDSHPKLSSQKHTRTGVR